MCKYGRTQKSCGNTVGSFSHSISLSLNFPSCFYNLLEIRNFLSGTSVTFHFSPQVCAATFKYSPIVDVIADCSIKRARHHVTIVIFKHSPQGYNTPFTTLLDKHLGKQRGKWLTPPSFRGVYFMISLIFNLIN